MPKLKRPHPVIVVPGISASKLRDTYPVQPELVWQVLPFMRDYDRVSLHPEDLRYERWKAGRDPVRTVADSVFEVPYRELIQELRHNLTSKSDQPTPIYPFAYDWRQPLELIEKELGLMIDEVINRTSLLPHYARSEWNNDPKVNLVGHSMGGVIIAGYLLRNRASKVYKVATLGTPFRGSHESEVKILTGTANWGVDSASREREAARVTPSLYYLLPDYENAVVDENNHNVDLFDVNSWQPGVLATLKEYIRLYGTSGPATLDRAREILDGMLRMARKYRNGLNKVKSPMDLGFNMAKYDNRTYPWMAIVGLGHKTRTLMRVKNAGTNSCYFDLDASVPLDEWGETPWSTNTGDGTVPFLGACPTFLETKRIVCVSDKEFDTFEFLDRSLSGEALGGLHGIMPKMNLLHRLLTAFFSEQYDYNNIKGLPAPGINKTDWLPPIPGLRPA